MFTVRTKGANIARAVMNKTMSDHLILSLEAFASFGAWAALDWAIVRSIGTMNIGVRAT